MRELLATLVLCAVACGCGSDTVTPNEIVTPVVNTSGKQTQHLTSGALQREFIVYKPAALSSAARAPVVFMVHGTSQDGEKFYADSHWKEKADAEGFIVVFPTGLSYCYSEDDNNDGDFVDSGERRVTTKWASGELGNPLTTPLCTAAEIAALTATNKALVDHPLADDVAFFDAMITFLDTYYTIDRKRVYATGFSNGASMTSRLAAERSTVYASAASAAGLLRVTAAPASRPMSFVFSVCSKDDGFDAALGVTDIPVRSTLLTEYPQIKTSIIDRYLTTLRLSGSYTYSEITVGNKKIGRFLFAASTAGASNTFTFAVLQDCFHQYPDGTNYPLALADPLWDLFKTQSLP